MKDYYVTLTGSKNNAGDFLIKYRAFELFKNFKPERNIIDYNSWEKITEEKLNTINMSKGLILLGGPSLQKFMYGKVYNLPELNKIKVPIITMGIGWFSKKGEWIDTYNYYLDNKTLELLDKINESGYLSSVRDYHTLNVLRNKGYNNFLMTGCPAYYDINYINNNLNINNIKKVAFSLGVSFIYSKSMEKLMKNIILKLKEYFYNEEFEVVFHHSLNKEILLKSKSGNNKHYIKHKEFENWLKSNNINYIDISGSAENLINYYSNVDLHIGFRVHAHIFMNSISKFSILLAEDGRGKAVEKVINGIILNSYLFFRNNIIYKILNRIINIDIYNSNNNIINEIIYNIEYEKKINFIRLKNSRKIINNNFEIMKDFIKQLP